MHAKHVENECAVLAMCILSILLLKTSELKISNTHVEQLCVECVMCVFVFFFFHKKMFLCSLDGWMDLLWIMWRGRVMNPTLLTMMRTAY